MLSLGAVLPLPQRPFSLTCLGYDSSGVDPFQSKILAGSCLLGPYLGGGWAGLGGTRGWDLSACWF